MPLYGPPAIDVTATPETKLGTLTVPLLDKGGAVYNVKAYGAVGDGVANNTAAIAAALAALPAAGGILLFPAGTYRTSQFTPPSNCTVAGVGPATIIDLIDDGSAAMQTCYFNTVSNVVVQDIQFRSSNAVSRTGSYGVIKVVSCTNVKVLRCMVTSSPGVGIFVMLSTNVLIEGNTVSGTFADGIHTQRANKSLRIIGNYVLNCQDDAIASVSYTDQANCEDVTIVGNTVAGTTVGGRGIAVIGGRNHTVSDNVVSNTYDAGIMCAVDPVAPSHYPFHVTIVGNTIKHAGFGGGSRQGVSLQGCRAVTVADNIVDDSFAQGIGLNGYAKDISILNNVVTRSGGRSIEGTATPNSVALGLTELFTNLGDTAPASWGLSEIRISGNKCRKTNNAAFAGDTIYLDGTALAITGLVVTDNDVFPNGTNFNSPIKLTGITQGVVANNRCQPYNGRGVEMYSSSGVTIANNTVAGMSAGVALFSTVECLISGNIANDATGQGIYCDGTSNNNLITGNEVRRSVALIVDQGTGNVFRSNAGYNPVGVVAPAVPASTVAVAAVNYDRTFYITTAAGVSTFAIQGGPTITIPASGFGTVRVPAGQTLTPTYANAPTWTVEGE